MAANQGQRTLGTDNRGAQGKVQSGEELARLALAALARYSASGLCDPVREKMHEEIGLRMYRMATSKEGMP